MRKGHNAGGKVAVLWGVGGRLRCCVWSSEDYFANGALKGITPLWATDLREK